jgi:hypothetical protein
MARSRDAVPPSDLAAFGSWASAVSSPPRDVEPWPTTDQRQPGIDHAGSMAVGSSSLLAGFCSPKLGLTEWTSGSSVVVSVIGEVDIATTTQLSDALGMALRRGVKGLVCDLSGVSFLGRPG